MTSLARQGRMQQAVIENEGSAGVEATNRQAARSEAAPLKLEEFLPYQFNVVASLTSQALSRVYAERYGIGIPEWRVLVTLGQFETMTGKAIGAHSHMHKTKVSRAVALLEHRDLLTRRANEADMRESLLSLTPAGRAIYEDLAPGALEFARRLMEVIDPADRDAFQRALGKVTERSARLVAELPKPDSGS
jgi:DNA-binding MarR family transcriptional regulator